LRYTVIAVLVFWTLFFLIFWLGVYVGTRTYC